jgi:hypothetical protein
MGKSVRINVCAIDCNGGCLSKKHLLEFEWFEDRKLG